MPAAKKVSNRNHIGQVFNKLIHQIGEQSEFELPDWLNKGKPTSYIFIRRNIYLTKKVKRRSDDDGIFCSCCTSSSPGSSSIVCGSNCHCGMLFSSCSSSCICGSKCNNKPFQHRRVKKLKLIQTEKCGSGIVAEEEIETGEFIIEYVGEVIDDKTCEERLWKMKHRGETNFYLCEINRDMVIDATHKGNKSRYINHSCEPNTQMQKWIIDGETRIGIFATRDIKKGDHLTYDYQFVQFGADQDCHCGAVGCRKKLGVKPNKPKTASDEALNLVATEVAQSPPKVHQNGGATTHVGATTHGDETLHGGETTHGGKSLSQAQICPRNCIGVVIRLSRPTSERCFGLIRHFDEFSRKHSVMFEDGVTEFIDMAKEDWEIANV